MPIRFRCTRCNRLLGIARRKGGADTTCPHCGSSIRVPMPEGAEDQVELSEIDELLNPASSVPAQASIAPLSLPQFDPAPIATSTVATRSASPAATPRAGQTSAKSAQAAPLADDDRPLFERDLDAVLGVTGKGSDGADDAKAKPHATSGLDAMSLGGERGHIVLSSQKATALAVAAVVLLALAFAAGYLLGSK